jgi:ABC-type dipeptide/oligopeptide/nickel transport system permease component
VAEYRLHVFDYNYSSWSMRAGIVMRLSGDPVPLLLPPDAPRSEIFRVRAELGLDRPLPVQYGSSSASRR